jgi:hypothetical protein
LAPFREHLAPFREHLAPLREHLAPFREHEGCESTFHHYSASSSCFCQRTFSEHSVNIR